MDLFEFFIEVMLMALEIVCDVYGPFCDLQGTTPSWQWGVLVVLALAAACVWMKADLSGLWAS